MPQFRDDRQHFVRQDFLKRIVQRGGLKYDDAIKAYGAMVEVFADAIVTGQKITVGQVLSIKPVKKKARRVNMGFGGHNKTIHLGNRISFKVIVFKQFLNKHQITWRL